MNKFILSFIFSLVFVTVGFSQETPTHPVKVEIDNNALMCPNLSMKIKRTLLQRKTQVADWSVDNAYTIASFNVSDNFSNKDSIIRMFVKESEYPLHIIKSIQIDNSEVYRKGSTNH